MTPAPTPVHRLVLDVQATQNPAHAHRGIGRYVKEQARALIRGGAVDALLLNPHLPFPRELDADLLCSPLLRWNTASELRRVAAGAGGPLAYHLMSPFELAAHAEGEVPVHAMHPGVPLVVTLYDLIPLLEPQRYAGDPERMRRYRVRTELVARADLVLAISRHSARTAVDRLGLDPARVAVVGAGVSPFFHPATPGDAPDLVLRRNLPALDRSYVLAVAGSEPRKNTERLVEAWATLPASLRDQHRLVLACHVDAETAAAWSATARSAGLAGGDVLVTGWVGDEVLRALYQRAQLFVLPSLAEGFGLPAAEALACGCPTITSATSSLPEVLDWPPATFDPTDPPAIATAIERGLTDAGYREQLVQRGGERVRDLTWPAVAARTTDALAGLPPASRARTELPVRLALMGPMPPTPSGIADYNARLVPHLAERCELDVFSPSPRPAQLAGCALRWFPPEALSRNLSPWSYDAVVYTIGNSDDHHSLFDQAEEFPGLLWMHDVRLPGLYLTYARDRRPGGDPRQFLRSRLMRQYRRRLPSDLDLELTDLPTDYVDAGLGMSKELVDVHRGVMVSNEVARRLLSLDQQPDARPTRTWVVPLAVPEPLTEVDAGDTTVVASFGIVAPVKAPALVIRAFAAASACGPPELDAARLVFVGEISAAERADLEAVAGACGIADRVDFTGLCTRADYDRWLGRASLAVQLRRATNGESSAAVHECIANGIPVITSVASATELPEGVVDLVPHDIGVEQLAGRIIRSLTDSRFVDRQRQAQAGYAATWGYAEVADRLLDIVAQLPTPAHPPS